VAVTFGTARRGLGGALAHAGLSSLSVIPITVLLYNGLLLCGFNVGIKGLMFAKAKS